MMLVLFLAELGEIFIIFYGIVLFYFEMFISIGYQFLQKKNEKSIQLWTLKQQNPTSHRPVWNIGKHNSIQFLYYCHAKWNP